jgi:hypothetical protein
LKNDIYRSLMLDREHKLILFKHYSKFKHMTAIEISRVYDIPVYKVKKVLDKAGIPYKTIETETKP